MQLEPKRNTFSIKILLVCLSVNTDMASSTITSCSAVLDILNCVFGQIIDNTETEKEAGTPRARWTNGARVKMLQRVCQRADFTVRRPSCWFTLKTLEF